MSENAPYKTGSNIVVPYTATDSDNAGITGLTVKISIFKISTSRYWDNASGAFDSVGEVQNTASEISNGLYEYTLTSGYVIGGGPYRIRVEATETTTGDIADQTIVQDVETESYIPTLKKNTAVSGYKFVMLSSTTGDPQSGFTVTAQRKLDADASWTTMTGSKVDNGNGVYSIDINVADANGDSGVWLFTASGAKPTIITFLTETP